MLRGSQSQKWPLAIAVSHQLHYNQLSMQTGKPSDSKLTPDDFIRDPRVEKSIQELRNQFGENMEKLLVSDTLDAYGNQYVNLVQKGGGVWGIALVGYTYVLEEAGIRFLKLAGTSAGAINTAMLGMIGAEDSQNAVHHKSGKKSGLILKYISELDMFQFVDGHPFAKWAIKNFISNEEFTRQLKSASLWIFGLLAFFVSLSVIFLGLSYHFHWAEIGAQLSFILTGLNTLVVVGVAFYLLHILKRLKGRGYGINPGNFFYEWIKEKMEENGVNSITDLNAKLSIPVPGLRLRPGSEQGLEGLEGDLTIIASELVTENKIEFPKMWNLFKANPGELHPARFVRASMSIPVFFESHMIVNIDKSNPVIREAWKHYFGVEDLEKIPTDARFVDGGMLSNFPVSIFYNPKIAVPRLPSFGIDLVDVDEEEVATSELANVYTWSMGDYFGRMLNTMRNYYDKDFMIKNKVYRKGVGEINLHGFNWLNFFISDQDKKDMFALGAQAATDFLKTFNWEAYKEGRVEVFKSLADEDQSVVLGDFRQPAENEQ